MFIVRHFHQTVALVHKYLMQNEINICIWLLYSKAGDCFVSSLAHSPTPSGVETVLSESGLREIGNWVLLTLQLTTVFP